MDDVIHAVKGRHSTEVLRIPGVSGFGVGQDDDGTQVLVVYVEAGRPDVAASLPREIEGYPVRVVESGTFRAQDA